MNSQGKLEFGDRLGPLVDARSDRLAAAVTTIVAVSAGVWVTVRLCVPWRWYPTKGVVPPSPPESPPSPPLSGGPPDSWWRGRPGGTRCLLVPGSWPPPPGGPPPPGDGGPPLPGDGGRSSPPEACREPCCNWAAWGGGPLERILLLTAPVLGTRCCDIGGVLARSRLWTGTTIVLLPLFLSRRFRCPAEAPKESPGEWAGTGTARATAATACTIFFSTGGAYGWVESPSANTGLDILAMRSASWRAWSSSYKTCSLWFASSCCKAWIAASLSLIASSNSWNKVCCLWACSSCWREKACLEAASRHTIASSCSVTTRRSWSIFHVDFAFAYSSWHACCRKAWCSWSRHMFHSWLEDPAGVPCAVYPPPVRHGLDIRLVMHDLWSKLTIILTLKTILESLYCEEFRLHKVLWLWASLGYKCMCFLTSHLPLLWKISIAKGWFLNMVCISR